ncbi:hypothetical protein, partial [uncultured Boseongicola sp.]|uniref:hypothetical protein n=1 Tax=uncultured Boseongicola sp. TaxID=1648499 RepID=UPI0026179C00
NATPAERTRAVVLKSTFFIFFPSCVKGSTQSGHAELISTVFPSVDPIKQADCSGLFKTPNGMVQLYNSD